MRLLLACSFSEIKFVSLLGSLSLEEPDHVTRRRFHLVLKIKNKRKFKFYEYTSPAGLPAPLCLRNLKSFFIFFKYSPRKVSYNFIKYFAIFYFSRIIRSDWLRFPRVLVLNFSADLLLWLSAIKARMSHVSFAYLILSTMIGPHFSMMNPQGGAI